MQPDAGSWNPAEALPDAFLQLPQQLFANDLRWIPESPAAVRAAFSQGNRWFDSNHAWLGVIPGVARLAGFCYPDMRIDGKPAAFFGYFDCLPDLQACRSLFVEMEHWARSQGAQVVYGPINFSTFGQYRLRLDNFNRAPFVGEPYNPEWYPELVQQLGYQLSHQYSSELLGDTRVLLTDVGDKYARQAAALTDDLTLRPLTAEVWNSNLDQLYPLVHSIFADNFAFTPIDEDSFRGGFSRSVTRQLCPKTSVVAFGHNENIAGFFLCYPDYAPLINRASDGLLCADTVGFDQHADLLPSPRRLIAKTGGVAPAYRNRKLFSVLSASIALKCPGHYEQVVAATVREDNLSRNFASRHCTSGRTHYGLFCREIA